MPKLNDHLGGKFDLDDDAQPIDLAAKPSSPSPGEEGEPDKPPKEKSALEAIDTSSLGSMAGGVVGSLFGPAGAAVGSSIGGVVGQAAAATRQTPGGPGATIDSGHVGQVGGFDPGQAALSVGQSLQHLALKGMSMKAAVNGFGKAF